MNLKTIAATVLFSCALVACSKQDNTTAQTKQAQTKPKDCKLIKDGEKRSKCVADELFQFTADKPVISRPATSY